MASLASIVKEVVFSYASSGLNLRTFALSNEEQGVYGVNIVDWPERHRAAGVVVLARVEGEQVVIEEDLTDRPPVDALVAVGIPRERIILKYAEPAKENQMP